MYVQLRRREATSLRGLLRTVNHSRETLRRSLNKLCALGWAYKVEAAGARAQLFVPWMPPDVERLLISALQRVQGEVALVGEWLMKCILDLIVTDLDFRDNAHPDWLVSGDGDLRESSLHRDARDFVRQQWRDSAKAGMCMRQVIQYVEVVAAELRIDVIANKVNGLLPLRPVPTESPLVRTLLNMCHSYANAVKRGERRARAQRS